MQEKSELYVKSAHGSSGAPAVRREKAAAAQKGNRPKVGNNLLLLLGGALVGLEQKQIWFAFNTREIIMRLYFESGTNFWELPWIQVTEFLVLTRPQCVPSLSTCGGGGGRGDPPPTHPCWWQRRWKAMQVLFRSCTTCYKHQHTSLQTSGGWVGGG